MLRGGLVWRTYIAGEVGEKNGTVRVMVFVLGAYWEPIAYVEDKNINMKLFKTRVICN